MLLPVYDSNMSHTSNVCVFLEHCSTIVLIRAVQVVGCASRGMGLRLVSRIRSQGYKPVYYTLQAAHSSNHVLFSLRFRLKNEADFSVQLMKVIQL